MRIKVLQIELITALFLFLVLSFYFHPAFAATGEPWNMPCPVQNLNQRADGLISAKNISVKFGNPKGACVISPQAPFAPYAIDTYDDLKSRYYAQAKSSAAVTKHDPIPLNYNGATDIYESSIDFRDNTKNHLYLINGNLLKRPGLGFLQDPDPLKPPGLVFVEGNFSIQSDIGYTGGLVFVVKGNVLIDKSVTVINAVIISSGTLYTATDTSNILNPNTCSHNSPVAASQLTVNGSLIALNSSNKIEFCRTLGAANNTTPAELIQHQPKYLVILRNLFSDTFQKWSEIQ